MTIRVYLVDDHALVRTGMKMILSGETDIEVVGEAETGEDALRDVRQLLPDVVLCDLHLPGVSGMEVTERIVRSHRNTRVVIVSVLEDGPLPKRLLEAGAAGYIGKGCDAQELLRAVRDVAVGRWGVVTWAPASRRTWPCRPWKAMVRRSTACRRASWK